MDIFQNVCNVTETYETAMITRDYTLPSLPTQICYEATRARATAYGDAHDEYKIPELIMYDAIPLAFYYDDCYYCYYYHYDCYDYYDDDKRRRLLLQISYYYDYDYEYYY